MSDLRFRAIETGRLVVRPFTAEDAEARFALMREAFEMNWPHGQLARWHGWTLDSYEVFAALWEPPYGDYAVALNATGELVGSVGIVPALVPWTALESATPADTFVSPEFGLFWAVFSAQQGRGYATEAVRTIVAFVFETLRVRRIVATTDYDNLASQAVMRNLGMRLLRNEGGDPSWCEVVGVLER
jgi:RimJ/RimL family protein N-acetyltransferase